MPYSLQIGSIPCHIVSDGRQLVDGGGFFGLVPRVLWERVIRPDDKNRIPVQMRSLLIPSSAGLILVDTGQGDKITPKERRIFGMADDNQRLAADLRRVGFTPEDVDIVLMTHLHADHAGGCTQWSEPDDPESEAVPAFPNARYLIQRLEMAEAAFPNERTRGTYFPDNWEPLRRSGQLELVDGDQDLAAGVRSVTVPGHTQSIQAVWVEDAGQSLLFLGDACSWAAHMDRLAWVPSFDLDPMASIESKRNLRRQAEEKNALLVFQHDGQVVTGRLRPGARGPVVEPETTEEAWPE
ncbi:MAG: MBL fold metallo-hydrolase [Caldilineaceae bacterium SB0668_bin_21]|nr:MBL fold metallo-hydrolase [Caldilineaceae bacterium SB0668_bin_21]MYC23228.1 MBL fold metallo-hydrolase [Caldilineaceae bacterium SB0662_bin_25]